MDSLTIGKVAKQADVGVETVRFYEREGLIAAPPRISGYRQYSGDTVDRLRFIKRAKGLGFSLKEIKELLELRIDPGTTCQQIRQRAEAKAADIEDKIRSLRRMKRALNKLAASCTGNGAVSACPILDALEDRQRR